MRVHVRRWLPLLRVVALALVVAAVPLPALAGDSPKAASPSAPSIAATAEKVASSVNLAPAQGQSQLPDDGKAVLGHPSFFETPAGVAVLAVIGAGLGYAIYSASNDRIHSVVRQGQ